MNSNRNSWSEEITSRAKTNETKWEWSFRLLAKPHLRRAVCLQPYGLIGLQPDLCPFQCSFITPLCLPWNKTIAVTNGDAQFCLEGAASNAKHIHLLYTAGHDHLSCFTGVRRMCISLWRGNIAPKQTNVQDAPKTGQLHLTVRVFKASEPICTIFGRLLLLYCRFVLNTC